MVPRALSIVAALALAARPLVAQMDMHEHVGAPPARLGRVHFPSSCSAPAAASVERGVALLHSFWYEEAGQAFRDAARADSTCVMAWWGEATSLLHPLWQPSSPKDLRDGAALVARARGIAAPTARERGYVEAIGAFYDADSTSGFAQRVRDWSDGLARLHAAEPADTEAAIFFALSLVAVAQNSPPDTTFALQRQAGDLLEPLFQLQPDHPGLAHYLIHAYDSPALAERAVRAANRYAGIAPSVPHALHMPSHIYTRLGMWDASLKSNGDAAAAARRYEVAQHLDAVWDQRLHSMDYMEYAYLQEGRAVEARRLVEAAVHVERWMPAHATAAEYALAAIPARYALERGRWREAAALTPRTGFVDPGAIAVTQFARAVGGARGGDTVAARTALDALSALDDSTAARHVPIWSGTVHAQRLAAAAWLALARGDTASAVSLAEQAADLEETTPKHPVTPGAILPARELLGDLLAAIGRPAEALRAYEASLAHAPRRARSLLGADRAAEHAGDRASAARWRREYRALMAHADGGRRPAASGS